MYKKITPFFLICETPLHAGTGNDLGVVDLPIQRERHTTFPKIESSSLKGSLREAFESNPAVDRKQIHLAFGYDDDERDESVKEHFKEFKQFQGALGFTNARLLLFPVKSMKGVFAWITCPKVLEQLKRDLSIEGVTVPDCELVALLNSGSSEVESGTCLVWHCQPLSCCEVSVGTGLVLGKYWEVSGMLRLATDHCHASPTS